MPTIDETFQMAVQLHQNGDVKRAEELYRQVITLNPKHTNAMCNLGVALMAQGRGEEALTIYQAALKVEPKHADAQYNLGNAYRRMGRFAEAIGCYQGVLRLAPNHSSAMHNMGIAYSMLGRWEQAVKTQEQVIRIEPGFAEAYAQLAEALQRTGRLDEAIATHQQFIRLRPNDPRGYHNVGLALAYRGNLEPALAALEQALRLNPNYPEAHNSIGVILEGMNQSERAFRHYLQAIQLKPNFADALNNIGTAATEIGLHDDAINYRRLSLNLQPNASYVYSNLLLAMHYPVHITPEQRFAEHKEWARRYADSLAPAFAATINDLNPDRRLKIGYISADFRQHTVASFIEPLLANHTHEAFHITCFNNAQRPDEVTERMKRHTDGWFEIHTLNDEKVVDTIRGQEIDILVDFSGHTAGNRLLVLARKPAPIQATVFGYPNTTGISTLDYRLVDPYSEPEGQSEAVCVERLWRLPEIAWCYQAPANAPAIEGQPMDQNGFIRFGCLNNLAKVTPPMLDVWAQILRQVPRARLVLLVGRGGFGAERIAKMMESRGINSDRLELLPRMSSDQYWAMHNKMDVYLDPFPYNGGVTSCDALWMGLPMVSLAGNTYHSRQGLLLLGHLGLSELVATSYEQYAKIAITWANDPNRLRELRQTMRDRMARSAIMDAKRYVQHLENAYREMWRIRTTH